MAAKSEVAKREAFALQRIQQALGLEKLPQVRSDYALAVKLETIAEAIERQLPRQEAGLSTKTIAELKAYADEQGIELGDVTRKADIIAVIEAFERGEVLTPPNEQGEAGANG